MSHVIILEGPDGGGKTTLANHLRDRYGYQIRKTNQPRPGEDLFTSYTQSLMDALNDWRPSVFDRHYLGECIYGPIMRGEDRLGEMGRTLIERLCAANGVTVLICKPNYSTLVEAWEAKKGEDYLKTQGQLTAVNDAYQRQYDRLNNFLHESSPFRLYAYDRHTAYRVLFSPSRRLPPGFSGYPESSVLVVGEQVNDAVVPWDLPFHCLTGSSKYLYDQVKALGIQEKDLAWANARNRGGVSNDLNQCLDVMPNLKRVVALGKDAEIVCERNFDSDTLRVIPHPQYWKRFKHGREDDYQNILKEAMSL